MAHTYFAASVGHRYGDTCQAFVAIERDSDIVGASGIGARLEELAERAAEYEREEIRAICEQGETDESTEECDCGSDIVVYGAYPMDVRDLFNAKELAEHRRALLKGETVVLYPH